MPVAVVGLTDAIQISAGVGLHTCALRAGGSAVCWGQGYHGELGDGNLDESSVPVAVVGLTDVTQISAGEDDTCALRAGGSVVC